MAVNLSPIGGVAGQFFDNNGNPLSGGKIYTYASGTTTNQATYTSAAGVTAHTNPIILDSAGRVPSGEIWLTDSAQYKFVVKTSADVLIGTYDNIIGINSNFVNFNVLEEIQTATAGQTVFTLANSYSPGTNTLQVFVDGVNQYDGVSYSYVETDSTTVTFTAGLHVGALVKFTTAVTLSAGVTDASLVTYSPPFTGSVETTVEAKLGQVVNVKDFGAVGDAVTDDRLAIMAADQYAYSTGQTVYFPSGVYRCSDGIVKTAKKWQGSGAPVLGTFPAEGDDKQYLRPGYKDKLPGSSLLFTGTGTQTTTTQRSDQFASFTYCVKTSVTGGSIEGMAIVLDDDVYTAGGALSAYGSDNSAVYGVGYYIDNAARCYHNDLVVFGYYTVSGIAIHTELATGVDNPDYNVFMQGSTMGKYGVSLIGSQSNDGLDTGLSGTQFYAYNIYSNDFPTRSAASFASASTWRCIYIDGYTDAVIDDINGHYFFGGCVRTYARYPVELDHASNTGFNQTVFELPNGTVVGENDTKEFKATSSTNDVFFNTCRFNTDPIYVAGFAGTMSGSLICTGQPYDGITVTKQESGTIYNTRIGVTGSDIAPVIQFSDGAPSSSTDGWVIKRTTDGLNNLQFKYDNSIEMNIDPTGGFGKTGLASGGGKVIASGAITIGEYSFYSVTNEGGAATDDLDTLNGGTYDGQILVLRAGNSSQDVVLKDGTGNLRLAGDFTLTHNQDRIMLMFDGTNWCELSRSDNTA